MTEKGLLENKYAKALLQAKCIINVAYGIDKCHNKAHCKSNMSMAA